MPTLPILYEDNHCLAVAKPAGWLTMGDVTGDPTVLDLAKDDIARRYHKPGAVYLGVVHRLDRPVSGVLLFARTSKAASRLSDQFRTHDVEKVYWAVVRGSVPPASGELVNELIKDSATNTVRVVPRKTLDSQTARLCYRRLGSIGPDTLVEVRPITGRSHQIRVQLAHQGWSIVGDAKYGSTASFPEGQIALHARSLSFVHPVRKEPMTVVCDPPATWSLWSGLWS